MHGGIRPDQTIPDPNDTINPEIVWIGVLSLSNLYLETRIYLFLRNRVLPSINRHTWQFRESPVGMDPHHVEPQPTTTMQMVSNVTVYLHYLRSRYKANRYNADGVGGHVAELAYYELAKKVLENMFFPPQGVDRRRVGDIVKMELIGEHLHSRFDPDNFRHIDPDHNPQWRDVLDGFLVRLTGQTSAELEQMTTTQAFKESPGSIARAAAVEQERAKFVRARMLEELRRRRANARAERFAVNEERHRKFLGAGSGARGVFKRPPFKRPTPAQLPPPPPMTMANLAARHPTSWVPMTSWVPQMLQMPPPPPQQRPPPPPPPQRQQRQPSPNYFTFDPPQQHQPPQTQEEKNRHAQYARLTRASPSPSK